MDIVMKKYDPRWAFQFEKIASQLHTDLTAAKINFVSIIHFGSTSIPNLNAKPIIDIMITVPASDFDTSESLFAMIDALREGDEQGGYYYIGNGGLLERWSFKLGIRDDDNGRPMMPLRNVYVVADGSILHRGAVAFRDCLRDENNSDLKEEYGTLKWELAERRDFVTIWDYTDEKKAVIRKVMKRAGWTDEEIIKKEELRVVNWPEEFII